MNQEIITPKKKKWYKRKLFYIMVVVVLVIGGVAYGQYRKSQQGPEYETAKVERGTLKQTVDATGNIESADEIELRFETSGRVGKIYKQVNQQVKAGDIIVDLNLSELNANVAQASAAVSKAQANLNKELAGDTPEYINNLQAKLDQAEANLEQTKAQHEDAINDAESALETAENNLELYQGGEDSLIVQDAYDDMLALLQSVQNTLADALVEADNILGIDNTLANDDFENILSMLDSNKLNVAKTKYYSAKSAKVDLDENLSTVSTASTNEQIDWAADTAEEGLLTMKDLLFAVAEVLDATRPVGNLTQTELTTMKTNIQTDRAAVSTKYTSLIDQSQAIETAKNSYTTNQIAYDKAKADLDNAKKQAEAEEASYKALVDQAQANLDDAKNPPREVDVASYRAALREAQANLSQATANRNKARIVAPIDGVIGKIAVKVGEYVGAADDVVKLISPHFEVKVDIPETDIIKISLGDEAEIKLDAFGDDIKFVGKVTEIEIGETVIQDVIYYKVTLSIEDDGEYEILNGMTANVLFYTEEKANVLYIPQRALRTNGIGKYARILENGEVKEIPVKTGLRGDGGFIEITEGLDEGQEVVLRVIE